MAPAEFDAAVIAICESNRFTYHRTPGVLMVQRPHVDEILGQLPVGTVIYGFDTFGLQGYRVKARLDGPSFDPGLSLDETLQAIQGWPTDPDLWIEIVGDLPARSENSDGS